ncbi:hypothetical protein LJC35_03625 [Parabacteroides sp. OttesenSCG-928-N08]|nr:hypothetical protein [Parabacteroides sp. OttesenSCG-928-N08]
MRRGDKWDELLTALFMVLAVAAIVCFFAASRPVFYAVAGVAVVLRIVQYLLRFFS